MRAAETGEGACLVEPVAELPPQHERVLVVGDRFLVAAEAVQGERVAVHRARLALRVRKGQLAEQLDRLAAVFERVVVPAEFGLAPGEGVQRPGFTVLVARLPVLLGRDLAVGQRFLVSPGALVQHAHAAVRPGLVVDIAQ